MYTFLLKCKFKALSLLDSCPPISQWGKAGDHSAGEVREEKGKNDQKCRKDSGHSSFHGGGGITLYTESTDSNTTICIPNYNDVFDF